MLKDFTCRNNLLTDRPEKGVGKRLGKGKAEKPGKRPAGDPQGGNNPHTLHTRARSKEKIRKEETRSHRGGEKGSADRRLPEDVKEDHLGPPRSIRRGGLNRIEGNRDGAMIKKKIRGKASYNGKKNLVPKSESAKACRGRRSNERSQNGGCISRGKKGCL